MPRTLYLLRHAKSSWKDISLSDFERPLKRRGRNGAKLIGERLRSEKLAGALVLCSPAVRTRETLEIVKTHAGLKADERFEQRIYEASLRDLVQVLSEIPDDKPLAIMVGHNPGFEELLAFLTGQARSVPTGALAKIEIAVESWKDVKPATGSLELFVTPKALGEVD